MVVVRPQFFLHESFRNEILQGVTCVLMGVDSLGHSMKIWNRDIYVTCISAVCMLKLEKFLYFVFNGLIEVPLVTIDQIDKYREECRRWWKGVSIYLRMFIFSWFELIYGIDNQESKVWVLFKWTYISYAGDLIKDRFVVPVDFIVRCISKGILKGNIQKTYFFKSLLF